MILTPLAILGLIAGAIAIGGLVYLIASITVKWLKSWKTRKQNKIVAAEAKDLMKAIAKDPNIAHINLDSLDDDDVVIAEYDPDSDEITQTGYADSAGELENVLESNNGIVILD